MNERETPFDGSFRGHVVRQGRNAVLTEQGCLLVTTEPSSQYLLDMHEIGAPLRGQAREVSRDRDRVEVDTIRITPGLPLSPGSQKMHSAAEGSFAFRGFITGTPKHRTLHMPAEHAILFTKEAASQYILNLFQEGDYVRGYAKLRISKEGNLLVTNVSIIGSPEVTQRMYGHLPDRNAWWRKPIYEVRYWWYCISKFAKKRMKPKDTPPGVPAEGVP